jgi:hypothetical protein
MSLSLSRLSVGGTENETRRHEGGRKESKMMGKVAKKVMLVGRATTFLVGLAVILALTVGLASTALAGTGIGARFQLGQTNTVNAITKLVGTVAGPSLVVDNNSTGTGATALDLQVEPGKAPMKVNSDAQVANLNSDELDNLDASAFVRSGSTYYKFKTTNGGGASIAGDSLLCDPGDLTLSGGYAQVEAGTAVFNSYPETLGPTAVGWRVSWRNDATADSVDINVLCADLGTPHQ